MIRFRSLLAAACALAGVALLILYAIMASGCILVRAPDASAASRKPASASAAAGLLPTPLAKLQGPALDLGADAAGPYWMRRVGGTAILEALQQDQVAELGRYQVDGAAKLRLSLVAGRRAPLYPRDRYLWAGSLQLEQLGRGSWEHFAAGQLGAGVLVRAFRTGDTPTDQGAAYAALEGPTPWTVGTGLGFWAPMAASSTGTVGIVRRTSYGIETELLHEGESWAAVRTGKAKHPGGGLFYGDPAVALDGAGDVHWAASVWRRYRDTGGPGGAARDWSCQGPVVVVDGREVVSSAASSPCVPGQTTPKIWLPSLAYVEGLGLCLAWQSRMPAGADPGAVSVAVLPDLRGLRLFPGFQGRLAAHGDRLWLTTSTGLYGRRYTTP